MRGTAPRPSFKTSPTRQRGNPARSSDQNGCSPINSFARSGRPLNATLFPSLARSEVARFRCTTALRSRRNPGKTCATRLGGPSYSPKLRRDDALVLNASKTSREHHRRSNDQESATFKRARRATVERARLGPNTDWRFRRYLAPLRLCVSPIAARIIRKSQLQRALARLISRSSCGPQLSCPS